MMMNSQLLNGLMILNVAAFLLFVLDKSFAKRGMWRIPESVLLGTALLGGSIGAYVGMQIFRHKTRKSMFRIGIPAIIGLHTVLVIWYCSVWIM